MEKSEVLYGDAGARRLDAIGNGLAGAYREAFAGAPWYERSRCVSSGVFYVDEPGCVCPDCGEGLQRAYDTEELVAGWQRTIRDEDGVMEVSFLDETPVSATIARPTTAVELYERKYADVGAMREWLVDTTPGDMVWIEDTFADRSVRPRGNMARRARTLGMIAVRYGGLPIMTRTKAPQIVVSTLKAAPQAILYEGTERLAYTQGEDLVSAARRGAVPDARTLLRVEGV